MTEPAIGSAIRSNARVVLAAMRRRRLHLNGLDPFPRRLALAGLLASSVAALLLMMHPLNLGLPGGELVIQRSDSPAMARLAFAAAMLTIAIAVGCLGGAMASEAWRLWRPAVAGLASVGLLLTPSVLATPGVAGPSLLFGLIGLLASLALVGIAVLGRPRRALVLAPLGAAPPVAAWLAVAVASLSGDTRMESELATSVSTGVLIVQLPLIAIAVWAVIEYGRGLTAVGRGVLRLHSRFGWLLPLALVLKVAYVLAFRSATLQAPLHESAFTIVWIGVLTLAVGWWLLRGRRIRLSGEAVTSATWVILVPILIGYGIPLLAFAALLVRNRLGLSAVTEIQAWMSAVETTQHYATALTPVLVATLALGGGVAVIRFAAPSWRGFGIFLLAYAAWTLPPAIAFALNELAGASFVDGSGGPLGLIHPVTLDLFVTTLVALLAIGWYAGLQRRVSPTTLLAILLLVTILDFTSQGLGGNLATILFWLGFGFPLVAQFLFDAASLNKETADKPMRVLRASGMTALAMGLALLLVALGFARPGGIDESELVKVLLLVPFIAVLLAGAISAPSEVVGEGVTEAAPVVVSEAPESQPASAMSRYASQYGMFALLAVVIVAGGVTLSARQLTPEPSPTPDPAIQHVAGVSIRIPPEYVMTLTSVPAYDQWASADGSAIFLFDFTITGADDDAEALEQAEVEMRDRLTLTGTAVEGPIETIELPVGRALKVTGTGGVVRNGTVTSVTFATRRHGWVVWIIGFDVSQEQAILDSLQLDAS